MRKTSSKWVTALKPNLCVAETDVMQEWKILFFANLFALTPAWLGSKGELSSKAALVSILGSKHAIRDVSCEYASFALQLRGASIVLLTWRFSGAMDGRLFRRKSPSLSTTFNPDEVVASLLMSSWTFKIWLSLVAIWQTGITLSHLHSKFLYVIIVYYDLGVYSTVNMYKVNKRISGKYSCCWRMNGNI